MIVGYARVSSKHQADTNALEQQIERLKHAGAEEIYIDIESGYKGTHRQELERLLEDIRAKRVSKVIVTRVDRLSRRGKQWFTLVEDFIKSEVELMALDEPIDLTTAAGKMQAGIIAILAQHHSDQKSESIRHGWEHLRNKGIATKAPFGLIKVGEKFEKDRRPFLCLLHQKSELSSCGQTSLTRYEIAIDIKSTFLEQRSIRKCLQGINQKYGIWVKSHSSEWGGRIARDMFRFSVSGLRDWLNSPVLRGHTRYRSAKGEYGNEHIIYNTHPSETIITEAEYTEIKQILDWNKNTRGFGSTRQTHPLSGLVFCAECNSACYKGSGSTTRRKDGTISKINKYYQCKNWSTRSCSQQKMAPVAPIEQAVVEALAQRAGEVASYALFEDEPIEPENIRDLRKEISNLEAINSNNPIIKNTIAQLNSQLRVLLGQDKNSNALDGYKHQILCDTFGDAEYWQFLTDEQKIPIYRTLISKILVRDGKPVSIELNV
ncbi:MAG: recombinase family protein [Calothrix sp. FI2-JRJ7]|jgi:DNA invertase Pin-like site-specific DNA recombinase|nr:recombinase family protein [Calothrix sp. FI2-JRJ7]